jgi:aromatic ring-cleaving dioxygenase
VIKVGDLAEVIGGAWDGQQVVIIPRTPNTHRDYERAKLHSGQRVRIHRRFLRVVKEEQ